MFTLSRIERLLLDHVESPLFILLVIVVAALASNESALLLEERLILVVHLRVVLALPASHVLALLVPWHVIVILALSRPILPLIVSHVGHVHHPHATVVVLVVLVATKHLLPGLLDLADGELGALEVPADLRIAVVRIVMVEHLVIGVHAVLVHLLLLLVEGVGVDPALVLFLLAVADVAHGLRSSQVLVSVSLGLKSLRIVLKCLSKSLPHLLVDLVAHIVEATVHVHVLIILLLGLSQLDHVHHDHRQ